MTSIWCLFSVANEVDQPDNNLVRWWSIKPTIEQLASFMACPLDLAGDAQIVQVVNLWQGRPEYFPSASKTYRLEEVHEGESP